MCLTFSEILVEVVYAEERRAVLTTYRLPTPAVVEGALTAASQDPRFTGIDVLNCSVGIFGQLVGRQHPLHDNDRVELYRPLAADPKVARRARVREANRRR